MQSYIAVLASFGMMSHHVVGPCDDLHLIVNQALDDSTCTVSCTYCVHFLQSDVQLKRMKIVARNMWEFPSVSYISGSIVVELADDNIHW